MKFLNEKLVLDKYKNKKILVLYGGISSERDVSIETGKSILNSLLDMKLNAEGLDFKFDKFEIFDEKNPDIIFIALHGKGGEDGRLQGFLDLKKICYTGAGFLASGIAMNKFLTKKLISMSNIPTANFFKIDFSKFFEDFENYENSTNFKHSEIFENIKKLVENNIAKKALSFPLVVKPNNNGSAIGVHIVNDIEELLTAVEKVKKLDSEILIEKYIKGREFSIGIIGDIALPVLEIKSKNSFYDYEAKYIDGKSNHFVPEDLNNRILEKMQGIAIDVARTLGVKGASRVDMIMEENNIFVLEINTIPGMTKNSLLPYAAGKIGISFNELVLLILENAYGKYGK